MTLANQPTIQSHSEAIATNPVWHERVRLLQALFEDIAQTRMQGLPFLHTGIKVQTVGFEQSMDNPELAYGVLITPWFMNLVALPLENQSCQSVGKSSAHQLGHENIEFLTAFEEAIGQFEFCSLFSPMFDFENQQAAIETATSFLQMIRTPVNSDAAEVAVQTPQAAVERPSRRAFFSGRGIAQGVSKL